MSFGEAVSAVLSKYVDFSGRARRREYWYWYLAVVLAEIVVAILYTMSNSLGTILYAILGLAIILPSLAVLVRRLHDTSRSGWWVFISLVPLVGGIWLLVLTLLDSTPGENSYGPNPKGL